MTLKQKITQSWLKTIAGEKVYARGIAYAKQGAVRILFFTHTHAGGEVEGTHPYRVDFSLDARGGVSAECTCPAMETFGFCKHAVALGLILMTREPQDGPIPKAFQPHSPDKFSVTYPNIAQWIHDGWIEIGRDGESAAMIRILDRGGLVWEGGTRSKSVDHMLQEAEQILEDFV